MAMVVMPLRMPGRRPAAARGRGPRFPVKHLHVVVIVAVVAVVVTLAIIAYRLFIYHISAVPALASLVSPIVDPLLEGFLVGQDVYLRALVVLRRDGHVGFVVSGLDH